MGSLLTHGAANAINEALAYVKNEYVLIGDADTVFVSINIFHNDEVNTNGAQLIFNTHNPIYLDRYLLRRDEIKFVERDKRGSRYYQKSLGWTEER